MRVGSDWAQFAGIVTEVTGAYVVGEVFLVSVKDGAPDQIGMKSFGIADYESPEHVFRTALEVACAAALDNNSQYPPRKGVISAGDITVN